jgi:hypothetical protein
VRFKQTFFLVCLIVVTNYSCKQQKAGKNITQGEIHYGITYSGKLGSIPKELKPNTLVVSFKENKILFEIVAPVGSTGISNLSNPKTGVFEMYVTFLGKYSYSCKPGETPPGFSSMEGMEIKKTSKSTNICGYKCKNAEVTFSSDRSKVYNIWYTNEIKVKNPNSVTPFKEIDGVLMSFFYFIGKTELQFEAEDVYNKEIPDKNFERKEKFVSVSKEYMNSLILRMISY